MLGFGAAYIRDLTVAFHSPTAARDGRQLQLQDLGRPELLAAKGFKESRVIRNLVGNPWNCDENLSWVASASQKVDQYTDSVDLYWNPFPIDVINAQDMICYMPPSMREKQAIRISRYQKFSC